MTSSNGFALRLGQGSHRLTRTFYGQSSENTSKKLLFPLHSTPSDRALHKAIETFARHSKAIRVIGPWSLHHQPANCRSGVKACNMRNLAGSVPTIKRRASPNLQTKSALSGPRDIDQISGFPTASKQRVLKVDETYDMAKGTGPVWGIKCVKLLSLEPLGPLKLLLTDSICNRAAMLYDFGVLQAPEWVWGSFSESKLLNQTVDRSPSPAALQLKCTGSCESHFTFICVVKSSVCRLSYSSNFPQKTIGEDVNLFWVLSGLHGLSSKRNVEPVKPWLQSQSCWKAPSEMLASFMSSSSTCANQTCLQTQAVHTAGKFDFYQTEGCSCRRLGVDSCRLQAITSNAVNVIWHLALFFPRGIMLHHRSCSAVAAQCLVLPKLIISCLTLFTFFWSVEPVATQCSKGTPVSHARNKSQESVIITT